MTQRIQHLLSACLIAGLAGAAGCTSPNPAFCRDPTPEVCGDGVDNDCDGLVDYDDLQDCQLHCTVDCPPLCDNDGDGFLSRGCGGNDCDDHDKDVFPGAKDLCNDGVDNNCDGLIDRQDPHCEDGCAGNTPVDFDVVIPGVEAVLVCASYCDLPGTSLSIRPKGKAPLKLALSCGDARCDSCQPEACPGMSCDAPRAIWRDASLRLSWHGRYFGRGVCEANQPCYAERCAAPGKYIARICLNLAAPGTGEGDYCTAPSQLVCTELEFDYPAATVRGKIELPRQASSGQADAQK